MGRHRRAGFYRKPICCLGFPMGGKFPTSIFLGSREENSKFKILCKRITEELRINNVFKKTIEARTATSNTNTVKTSRQ